MNTGRTLTTRHSMILGWIVAAILALTANFGMMAVDQIVGTQFTPYVNACASQGGGC